MNLALTSVPSVQRNRYQHKDMSSTRCPLGTELATCSHATLLEAHARAASATMPPEMTTRPARSIHQHARDAADTARLVHVP
eukprot:6183724-Pleurochrysis_carterae.AAC.1